MSERPTAASTAVLYNGLSTEMLVTYADAVTGWLHILQFQEARADTGEVELLVNFEWERRAPAGVALVLPEAGHPLVKLDDYWLMWRVGNLLYGQSVHHPVALSSAVGEAEWLIDRPIVTRSQELHAYGWRGGKLVRHRYAAPRGGEQLVKVEVLMDIGERPARSVCGPLPGDDGGTGIIAYVNEAKGSITATVLYVRGGKVMTLEGKAEGRYRIMGRHRMGLHVGTKTRPALALMVESLDDESYILLEARFDFAKKECVWKRTRLENTPPAGLESASIYYCRTQDAPEPYILAVDKAGDLVSPRRRNVVKIREGVGTGYGYPILTTSANRYEAVGEGAEIKLRLL